MLKRKVQFYEMLLVIHVILFSAATFCLEKNNLKCITVHAVSRKEVLRLIYKESYGFHKCVSCLS